MDLVEAYKWFLLANRWGFRVDGTIYLGKHITTAQKARAEQAAAAFGKRR